MDGAILPLTFYCRNAQLCLAKAMELQKSGFGAEELQQLRTFITLVSETIPSHPNYCNRQGDKQVLELHTYLPEATERISELKDCVDSTRIRPKPTTHGRHNSKQTKPPLDSSTASKALAKTAGRGHRNCDSSSSDSMTKPPKSVRLAGTSRSPKTPLAEKDQKWDVHMVPNIQETYGTMLAKSGTPPRPIPPIHRLRDAKPPLRRSQYGKEVTRSQALQQSAAGELMPYLPKSRDTLRARGGRGTTVTSTCGRSSNTERSSSKATKAEMPFNSGHKSPSYEKSSFAHEGPKNGGKADHGGRVECNESTQEVVLIKSCTHVSSKHKLAKHATGGRVRTQTTESQDRQLEQKCSEMVGTLGINQDEGEQSSYEIEDQMPQGFRTGYSRESNMFDGITHNHQGTKKGHEDLQRYWSRGDGLQEWKGDFVTESERTHGDYGGGESFDSSPVRASQSKHRSNIVRRVDNRPASAPRRMQGAVVELKPREAGENMSEVEVNERKCRIDLLASLGKHEKPAELQRGMKEDCEHFRREMRLLKEKAKDSRIREVEVEGLAEKLQRRLVDEMDLASGDIIRLNHSRSRNDKDKVCAMHGTTVDSPHINRLRGGHPLVKQGPEPSEVQEYESGGVQTSYKSASVTASGSTSGSSLTSGLPLSHYIQKLKDFSPDSQLGSASLEVLTSVNKAAGNHEKILIEDTAALPTSNERGDALSSVLSAPTTLSGGPAPALLLPASTNSSNSSHRLPRPQRPRIVHNQLVLSRPSSLYTSLARPTQTQGTPKFRTLQPDSGSVAMFNLNPESHLVPPNADVETSPTTVTTVDGQLLYPHFHNGTENNSSLEANDDKINNVQRLVGELKGSVEGMKIRLEVDGQGWRGRVEGLEKELESLKEEADDEIIAAKHSLRNEMRVKLGDLMAEMEKLRRHERDEVEEMVEERIEKQLQTQRDCRSIGEMKDEIRLLWAEVEALVKSREEMQGHVEHLASVAQKAQEHAKEQEMLKSENGYLRKQLQSFKNDGVQVRLEAEDFRVKREDLRLALDKLREEGTDMKLEIQSLKKVEKLIEIEIENIRTGLVKLQEETHDLELQKGTSQIEGGRERLLIMERVESLSQLYLGGLEEVRADVCNVKFNCRDRIQDFENQWKEFKKQQPEGSTLAFKKMLLDELDHFRGEIAEMVEMERGLLRQTLEQESEAVQCQVKDLLISSKGDIVNVLKLDVQKWLQGMHEEVFLMTEALKQDLDTLKNELGRTQEGAEDLIQIVSVAQVQRDVAAAAAADASMSAANATNTLMDVTSNINHEMTNVRYRMKQFQEDLTVENDFVTTAMYEARKVSQELQKEKEAALVTVQEAQKKHQELQDCLEKESPRLLTALSVIQQERDTALQAASEATSSAAKAGEALAEILGTYNLEMAKARHMRTQLQEDLEKEKVGLERERELAIEHSHSAQNRFSEELQLAIDDWKRAMNAEIAKAKEVTDELEKQFRRRIPFDPDHPNLQLSTTSFGGQADIKNYISKTEESVSSLAAMVKELQDYKEHVSEAEKRRLILKNHENERKEQHWNGEISQITQVVRVVEKRVLDVCEDYTEVRKKLKKCEGTQLDLVHTVEEVTSTTNDLAKTVSSWLPRYQAAARIVNDLSSKVERVEERVEGFSCDEGLAQRISRVAETKVEGLKEFVLSSAPMKAIDQELRVLHEHVESCDRIHCQAIGEVVSRLKGLEQTVSRGPAGQPSPGLSLNVAYTDGAETRKQGVELLRQSVEALEGKMEFITEHTGALVGGHESTTDSRLLGLESRIEHVASATFTNLRLLDNKVDRVSLGMQSAVEGAALAESKCAALGAELVKVFRMLAACKDPINSGSSTSRQQMINNTQRGQSNSPPTRVPNPQLDSHSQSPRNRSTTVTRSNHMRPVFPPKRRSRIYISPIRLKVFAGQKRGNHRNMARMEETDSTKISTGSDSGKVTARDQAEGENACSEASEEGSSPNNQSFCHLRTSLNDPVIGCKLHTQRAQLAVQDRISPQLKCHSPLERRHESLGKVGRQNAAVRLEAGRIHINVSHRSASVGQSDKRENLIAVQS